MAATTFLEAQLTVHAPPPLRPGEAPRKPDAVKDAKYHIVYLLNEVTRLADKIKARIKDEESLTEFFDAVLQGKKPVHWKELLALKSTIDSAAGKVGPATKALQEAEVKRQAREERKAAKAVVPPATDPVAAAAPAPAPAPATTALAAAGGAGRSSSDDSSEEAGRPKSKKATVAIVGGAGSEDAGRPKKTEEKTDGKAEGKKQTAAKKEKIGAALREAAWDYWIGPDCGKTKCPVCQERNVRQTDFSAGHIHAEACGGATSAENLLPICSSCNVRMATENLHEFCKRIFGRDIVLPAKK